MNSIFIFIQIFILALFIFFSYDKYVSSESEYINENLEFKFQFRNKTEHLPVSQSKFIYALKTTFPQLEEKIPEFTYHREYEKISKYLKLFINNESYVKVFMKEGFLYLFGGNNNLSTEGDYFPAQGHIALFRMDLQLAKVNSNISDEIWNLQVGNSEKTEIEGERSEVNKTYKRTKLDLDNIFITNKLDFDSNLILSLDWEMVWHRKIPGLIGKIAFNSDNTILCLSYKYLSYTKLYSGFKYRIRYYNNLLKPQKVSEILTEEPKEFSKLIKGNTEDGIEYKNTYSTQEFEDFATNTNQIITALSISDRLITYSALYDLYQFRVIEKQERKWVEVLYGPRIWRAGQHVEVVPLIQLLENDTQLFTLNIRYLNAYQAYKYIWYSGDTNKNLLIRVNLYDLEEALDSKTEELEFQNWSHLYTTDNQNVIGVAQIMFYVNCLNGIKKEEFHITTPKSSKILRFLFYNLNKVYTINYSDEAETQGIYFNYLTEDGINLNSFSATDDNILALLHSENSQSIFIMQRDKMQQLMEHQISEITQEHLPKYMKDKPIVTVFAPPQYRLAGLADYLMGIIIFEGGDVSIFRLLQEKQNTTYMFWILGINSILFFGYFLAKAFRSIYM